jgi:hypothetical protein
MYDFKPFTGTNVRSDDHITVTSSYAFGFPTKFFKDNNLENFKFVSLFFDETNKAVGFLFHNNDQEKHKFKILKSQKGYGGSAVAASFFKSYNLKPIEYKGKYEWKKHTLESVGEIYVIELKKKEMPVSIT